ncbi:hypothetical protein MesoLj113a_70870 [Mesorhizobium sp. 113-1-2]|nr:Uncharacterized protein MLTONO_5491 [Mesorhizobium loti]BCG75929.1 hypothetical protein MesoLj113a_70870 [Mesorhizobium sp. 113-1-2]BCG82696.1 hypothetical protein MesoLj113b_62380 [Mesorhizobium sp. 113-3-3]BCG90573.1 hypothetical protein MesoLj113c_66830 [Mesorhizobium sp. 113-3-9]BCG97174.1 hypothetical protein MesoLj131a_60380 [Mesorhizobium sp. 131-2-1]BCH04246.1 hypothetical protein MesoLj131b_62450 [Mesorhizobium sp. 131-2-5]BCH18976.1 hypothetical protein MesoLjLa_58270 [Mesorhizob
MRGAHGALHNPQSADLPNLRALGSNISPSPDVTLTWVYLESHCVHLFRQTSGSCPYLGPAAAVSEIAVDKPRRSHADDA